MPQPKRAELIDVLKRVEAGTPLCAADGDAVRFLIAGAFMHVTPGFDRDDVCPYRLTEAGRAKLRDAQRTPRRQQGVT